MEVEKIKQLGYFDNIKIDGKISPICGSVGTNIDSNISFTESLMKSEDSFRNDVAHLYIQLIGESIQDDIFLDKTEMEDDRRENGLKQIKDCKGFDRYLIAYSNILLVKGNSALPFERDADDIVDNMHLLAKADDKFQLLISALQLSNYISERYSKYSENATIAILDTVYVYKLFRRCGVSSWIHKNIHDIINTYSMIKPAGAILICGDFSHEAMSNFGMTSDKYNKMLEKHYTEAGYRDINRLHIRGIRATMPIMYKIFV